MSSQHAGLRLSELITRYARPYWGRIAAGTALLLVTNALAMSIPWQMKRAVDSLQAGGITDVFYQAIGLLFGAAVGMAGVRVASRWVLFGVGRNVENDVRSDLFGFLLDQEPQYFAQQSVGDLMSRLANDITAIRLLFGFALLNLVNTAVALTMSVAFMLHLNPMLTACALSIIPIMGIVLLRFGRNLHENFLSVQTELGSFSAFLQEGMAGVEVIQVYGLQQPYEAVFRQRNDAYLNANLKLARIRALMTPVWVFIAGLGGLIILGVGGYEVMHGAMSLGDFVAFQGYLAQLTWPIMVFGWLYNTLQRGLASLRRINEVLVAPIILPPALPMGAQVDDAPVLRCRDLGFTVGGEAPGSSGGRHAFTVGPLDLDVLRGQWLGITGPTGSGKSLLLRAIMGYLQSSGRIEYCAAQVDRPQLAQFRGYTAYVPTHPLLFTGTVRENLSVIGTQPPSEAELHRVLEQVIFTEDLQQFPEGLDSLIGERGITLSGGQRQRLGIARALLLRRPLLLLDDSLSAVDAETESRLVHNLRAMEELTVVVSSHRMTLLNRCDQVLVMQAGQRVEWGAPAELMNRQGLYAALHATAQLQRVLEQEL